MPRKNALTKTLEKYDEIARRRFVERMLKIGEEKPITPALRAYLRVLKIVGITAVFICGPIGGWLYNEWGEGSITSPMFGAFMIPFIFVGVMIAIVLLIKIPME